MVQNLNDIYRLVKSPAYKMTYNSAHHQDPNRKSYDLFCNTYVSEHIHIDIDDNCMEIYKYRNMNSEFYANVPTTNKRDRHTIKRFDDLLFDKCIDTVIANNNQILNKDNQR